jgi:hypothetical protein
MRVMFMFLVICRVQGACLLAPPLQTTTANWLVSDPYNSLARPEPKPSIAAFELPLLPAPPRPALRRF